MVYPHIFLLASSLRGHDAETKYGGRECADKVHNLLGTEDFWRYQELCEKDVFDEWQRES